MKGTAVEHFAVKNSVTVERLGFGIYIAAGSFPGRWGNMMTRLKNSVFAEARDHCAQQNRAIRIDSQSESIDADGGSGQFKIGFICRERTKEDDSPSPTKEKP